MKPTHETQVRPLAGLDPEQQREAWRIASNGNSQPTEKEVKAAVQKITGNGNKPPTPPKERQSEPEVIDLYNKGLTLREISNQTGVLPRVVDYIVREEKIRRSVEPQITPEMLSMSAQQKLDLAIRQHRKKLDQDFNTAVLAEGRKYLERVSPALRQREHLADRIIRMRKGCMTRAIYMLILSCLHPDWVVDEKQKARYADAFREFVKLEKLLLSEKESPTDIPKMPQTSAEWEQARRQATEARKAKRQQSNLARR